MREKSATKNKNKLISKTIVANYPTSTFLSKPQRRRGQTESSDSESASNQR